MAIAKDIKLAHSVFALPFALLAMFLGAGFEQRLPRWGEVILIVLCMVTARTVAMTVNRWADASFDALNPRTAGRAIPAGRVSSRHMLAAAAAFAAMFALCCGGFLLVYDNPWPLILCPLVLVLLVTYSFAKRVTWLCHLLLGIALGISPVAAVIAIAPAYLAQPTAYLIALMVTCWVAGFDVIYAMQDVAVDRAQGLSSIPASLGEGRAVWISRTWHVIAMVTLIAAWLLDEHLRACFAIGIALAGLLLIMEHVLIARSPRHSLHPAFMTINGLISLLLGAAGIVDVLR
ncbi:MAG: 4-hydroxybenzoate octaprenyltransferase [Phycisphaeraceae bacterium]|nr:4-hydroxybenzoate octaprenyltransferase [Phycisphaeraceae bacterium]